MYSKLIELEPQSPIHCANRALEYIYVKKYDEALADYNAILESYSIELIYDFRARIYMLKGEKAIAKADYNRVIELSAYPDKSSRAHYAYLGLGEYDKAIEFFDKYIFNNGEDAIAYYEKACVYSMIGKHTEALEALRTALEMNYKNFVFLENDYCLMPLRKMPEYKSLVNEYKEKNKKRLEEMFRIVEN